MKEVEKPTRDPDIVLPEYMGWAEVRVWVTESIFGMDSCYFDCISSDHLGLYRCYDATMYLDRIVKIFSESNPRRKVVVEFLDSLDNILLCVE